MNYEELHDTLANLMIRIPKDPDLHQLRDLYAETRDKLNAAQRILARALPRAASLKSDIIRCQAHIEALENHYRINRSKQIRECKNAPERVALLREWTSDQHDKLSDMKANSVIVSELANHARTVMDQLKLAFEQTSRAQASIEMEWKITTNRA